ncbi:hypothetical protein JCM6882_005000 [Rhodosporidiobolus microsporus]
MSSFRRKSPSSPLPGTRPSPSGSPLLSTGLPALDDLLGGGLPLHASLLVEHDAPTSYADLVLRYWVAQGLESSQDVCVVAAGVDGGPEGVVEALMGTEGGEGRGGDKERDEDREEREQEERLKEKMKIAFRYEGMKQHQTTLSEGRASTTTCSASDPHPFSSVFDLTTTRALSPSDRARLHLIDVDDLPSSSSCSASSSGAGIYDALYERIERLVEEGGFRVPSSPSSPRKVLRIALSNFGSPSWGPCSAPALYSFLSRLRHLSSPSLSHTSTLTLFPSYLFSSPTPSSSSSSSSSSSTSSPLLTRLSHASSAHLLLSSLSSSPALAAQFPRHAGLLSFPKLPTLPPGGLVPPGARQSVLRGLGGGGEGRDNLVGFRVKRRRFVVEVVSDDPVAAGGGGEDEAEKRKRERRRRVEEANRKEREMAGEGVQATDVLLGKMGERVAQVRIGGDEEEREGEGDAVGVDDSARAQAKELPPPVPVVDPSPASSAPAPVSSPPPPPAAAASPGGLKKSAFRKKGVRIGGGVSFGGDDDGEKVKKEKEEKAPQPPHQSVSRMLHSRPDLLDF